MRSTIRFIVLLALPFFGGSAAPALAQLTPDLQACRLKGIEREVRCGSVTVAENPDAPAGTTA